MIRHEFVEMVDDCSMCLCGLPALGHDAIMDRIARTEDGPGLGPQAQ